MKQSNQRIVGLDVHPASFAVPILAGRDPASARVLSTSTRVELKELEHWAERHISKDDMLVLEASGNAFAVAGRLRALAARSRSSTATRRIRSAKSTVPMIGPMRSKSPASI